MKVWILGEKRAREPVFLSLHHSDLIHLLTHEHLLANEDSDLVTSKVTDRDNRLCCRFGPGPSGIEKGQSTKTRSFPCVDLRTASTS